MEHIEGVTDWEAYAKNIQTAWEKEHCRQTAAYQNLEAEMTKLLQLLQDSQRNQSDFMIASAKAIDQFRSEYQGLQQEVRSFLKGTRNQVQQSDAFFRLEERLNDILTKLNQFEQQLVTYQHPSASVAPLQRTSSSISPQQRLSSSVPPQESSPLVQRASSYHPRESSTIRG